MASSNRQIECCICMQEFNTTSRRPRGLPCLHNYCTECIQSCIGHGRNTCSICRKPYTATRVEDIPINNSLEALIEMLVQMASKSLQTNDSNGEEDEFTKGLCPNHKSCLCYFKCVTHNAYICHQCTVKVHPPHKCEVIEIKEIVLGEKEKILRDAHQSITLLESASSRLENIVTEKKLVINSKQEQVNILLLQIDNEQKVIDHVQMELNENKIKSSQLTEHIRSLQISTTQSRITKQSAKLQDKVKSLQILLPEHEEQYENKDSYEFLLKDPRRLSKAIEKGDRNIYAVDNASIVRSSKLQYENGIVKINTLGNDVKPTLNATVIPIASLMSILCTQPVVYLDLEAQGHPLGRLRILLTCGPRRKEQAIKIFTGIAGTTLKGHCFGYAWCVGKPGECIYCCDYLDANGSTSYKLLVADPELNTCKVYVAGQVTGYKDHAGFLICTTTAASFTSMAPELGRVLTGLDMLSTAMRQYKRLDAKHIKIVNTGLEIKS